MSFEFIKNANNKFFKHKKIEIGTDVKLIANLRNDSDRQGLQVQIENIIDDDTFVGVLTGGGRSCDVCNEQFCTTDWFYCKNCDLDCHASCMKDMSSEDAICEHTNEYHVYYMCANFDLSYENIDLDYSNNVKIFFKRYNIFKIF